MASSSGNQLRRLPVAIELICLVDLYNIVMKDSIVLLTNCF